VFFWSEVRPGTRIALGLYAVTMALTLVYTGEHYVIDVLVGWAYAVVVVLAARVVTRRRSA
jgi:membrane-associated phospholipid phosphatase